MGTTDIARFKMQTCGKDATLPSEVRASCRLAERVIVQQQRTIRDLLDRLDSMVAETNWARADGRAEAKAEAKAEARAEA